MKHPINYRKSEKTGINYNKKTKDKIVNLLDDLYISRKRVRFYWGDTETGKDWGDCYDIVGRVCKTTGSVPISILVYNNRCFGGGAILDNCIVKIEHANKNEGGIIYVHPKYHK